MNDLTELTGIARLLASSGYFEKGSGEQAVAQLATKILAGREMGLGPFAAVQGIHVIQGRPALSANLIAAGIKSSKRYDYRVIRLDNEVCEIEFFEVNSQGSFESLGKSAFSAADAKAAGTQNMNKYPRNMLFARAISNGARWYCPDLFNGAAVYTPEELGAVVDGDGNVMAVPQQRLLPEPEPQAEPAQQLPEPANLWKKPDDAYIWAVEHGFSIDDSKNLFADIITEKHNGRLTRQNLHAVFAEFHSLILSSGEIDTTDVPELEF